MCVDWDEVKKADLEDSRALSKLAKDLAGPNRRELLRYVGDLGRQVELSILSRTFPSQVACQLVGIQRIRVKTTGMRRSGPAEVPVGTESPGIGPQTRGERVCSRVRRVRCLDLASARYIERNANLCLDDTNDLVVEDTPQHFLPFLYYGRILEVRANTEADNMVNDLLHLLGFAGACHFECS